MKRIILSLVFMYCLVAFSFAQQNHISLDSCQIWARGNYPAIEQFDLINATRDYTIANANTMYIPQIGLKGIAGFVDGLPNLSMPSPTGGSSQANDPFKLIGIVNVNQTVWDGGAIIKQKRVARANAEVEASNVELSLYNLRERVSNLYFGIMLAKEQLKQIDLQEDYLLENLKTVNVALANGAAYNSDIDELKVSLLNIEQNRAQLLNNLKAYTSMLSYMTAKTILPSDSVEKPNLNFTLRDTLINRPELNLFEKQKSYYQAQDMGVAEILPRVSLMGLGVFLTPEVNIMNSSLNRLMIGGLSLNWNIGGTTYTFGNDKKRLKIATDRAEVEKESFLFNTKLQMMQVGEDVRKWNDLLTSDAEIVRLRTVLKNAAQVKYDNGVISMTDLLKAVNDETIARQNENLHNIQRLMSIYQYNILSGN